MIYAGVLSTIYTSTLTPKVYSWLEENEHNVHVWRLFMLLL